MTDSNKNMDENIEEIKLAAEQGDAQAQHSFGNRYYYGEDVEKDFEVAVEWFRLAAEQKHAEAQYDLGVCYAGGIGVEQNDGVAFEWYRRAAENGDSPAQNKLGVYYAQGRGVKRDYKKAFEWASKCAAKKSLDADYAQHNLGIFFFEGKGVEANIGKSLYWFNQAVKNTDRQSLLKKIRGFSRGKIKWELESSSNSLNSKFSFAEWGGLVDSVDQKIRQVKVVSPDAVSSSSKPKNSNDFN